MTTSDLISLQYPNCGGKLNVETNTLSLVCRSCGTEHMVRRSADGVMLESYARCPVCNRNDSVEKAAAEGKRREVQAENEREMAAWQRAMGRWERLYYNSDRDL
jgi:hypothetical protein